MKSWKIPKICFFSGFRRNMKAIITIWMCLILAQINRSENLKNLKIVAEWSKLDYVFPRLDLRQSAIRNGQFIQGNGVPIDVDVDYRESSPSRIFVTIPRFTVGIPVTLGYIAGHGNLIQPYPEYSWHSSHGRDCDGITSVFRITVNIFNRHF